MQSKLEKGRRDMRQHILDSALRLFAGNGYFNTSIHDIKQEADVSIGSIYNHFGSKEGVAKALYDSLLARMEAVVDEASRECPGTYQRGRSLVQRLFELTEQAPETMRFILDAKHREFLPDEPPICSARPFVKLRDIVNEGITSGEICPMDPWVAASCTFGPALRMISLYLDGVLPGSLTRHAESVWESSWRSVRGPGSGPEGLEAPGPAPLVEVTERGSS